MPEPILFARGTDPRDAGFPPPEDRSGNGTHTAAAAVTAAVSATPATSALSRRPGGRAT
ncbi:hypothetical protein OAO87_04380 [bacterium]|nr:hypothetical protein [bacterium]